MQRSRVHRTQLMMQWRSAAVCRDCVKDARRSFKLQDMHCNKVQYSHAGPEFSWLCELSETCGALAMHVRGIGLQECCAHTNIGVCHINLIHCLVLLTS